MKKILFTGGHHNSALEILEELKKNLPNKEFRIIWVGRKYVSSKSKVLSPEYNDVNPFIDQFYDIKAGKLHRIRSLFYIHKVIHGLFLVPLGFIQSFYILIKERPVLIVSWGGYMALPIVVIGKILGIKSVTHEQTVTLGLANHLISRLVDIVYTAWPVKYYPLDIQSKSKHIGLPVRKLKNVHDKFFSNSKPVLLVMGGKMGSGFINEVVTENLGELIKRANIIWSYGGASNINLDYVNQLVRSNVEIQNGLIYKDYFNKDEMAGIFPSVSIAFSRSGAHSVYEYAVFKIYALLCPLPKSSRDEQLKNAKMLEDFGIAEIMNEESYTKDLFMNKIDTIISKYAQKKDFNYSIITNSTEKFTEEILKLII